MRRIFYLIAAFLFITPIMARAGQSIVENDTVVCPGLQLQLHGIPATQLTLTVDDQYSGVIPIGFGFTFYGNTYTKCVISSNGYICFDTTKANQFSQWAISTGIPGNANCTNSIMGHYADIYPFAGGTIDYALTGQAPNRHFIVNFCAVPMFSCTTLLTTFQIVLNEIDNTTEVHIRNKPTCTAWQNGAAIEGVEDATGANATVVPGRNFPGSWTVTNSSHKFTPNGTTSYTVASIPFSPYASNGGSFTWFANTIGGTPYATTQTISVTATAGTSTYYLRAIHCSDTTYDSVKVTGSGGAHIDSVSKTNPTQCGAMNGTATLWGLTPNHQFTLHYSKNGVAQAPFTITSNNIGHYTLTGLGAGIYSGFFIVDNPCISNTVGPVTLTNPSVTAGYTYNINYGCGGDTVSFTNASITAGPLSYTWNFGDGTSATTTNPTHIFNTQAVFNVQLIASNYSTGGSCADTIAKNINLVHPIHAAFTVSKDSACSKQSVIFTNNSTVTTGNNITPQYFWSFGDGSTSTQMSPTHAYINSGTYTARLIVKNFVPCYDTTYHTIVIDSLPFVNFMIGDTVLCQGHHTVFTGNILSVGLTGYEWSFSDGSYNPNMNPVVHSFDSLGIAHIKLTAHYRLCPDTTYDRTVNIIPYPHIDLGPDTALCPGAAAIPLYDHATNTGGTYLWSTGSTTSAITATAPGTYSATVNVNGCANSDTVVVLNDCYLNIPNIFTPNGDGNNDYFFPRQFLSSSIVAFKMDIFDRWGQLIYSTTHTDGRGWDGAFNSKPQPEGVYIYIIDAAFENGKREHHQGNITLLR